MEGDQQRQPENDQNQETRASINPDEPNKESKPVQKKTKQSSKTDEFDSDGVSLIEDHFAQYYDENGKPHQIKRFTWKNKNKIQIQVINYGAKVISILMPDRRGDIEDILLGFDDLGGYLFYDKFYFGSVIGRVSNVIKNSTFAIGNQRFIVGSNHGNHSLHGGFSGLDKVVWDTYITGKKVVMSHISPHLTEGYPGDLLIRAVFELSAKNEFKVSFDAQTTRPTCIDLSHLLYFNLAGHHTGPDEIYRHILTLNCNCFTPQVNKIPTGEILNVIHTEFDLQVPKILGKAIGIVPKDGFNQNLCVNRGMYQDECFVGRILHPPSGRMLEIYSNQPGVQLNTANDFGYRNVLSMQEIVQSKSIIKADKDISEKVDKSMLLYQKVHEKVIDILKIDEQQNFDDIKQLIYTFSCLKSKKRAESEVTVSDEDLMITPMQHEYLKKAREIVCENEETDDDCLNLKDTLSTILNIVQVTEEPPAPLRTSLTEEETQRKSTVSAKKASIASTSGVKRAESTKYSTAEFSEKASDKVINRSSGVLKAVSPKQSVSINDKTTKKSVNTIPVYYKNSEQIRGKGRALYRAHGAIALQTQNYPNAINFKNFPNSILNPGEVYRHNIVYRFWIRAGNPNKWIKRNLLENKQRANKT